MNEEFRWAAIYLFSNDELEEPGTEDSIAEMSALYK
jgi:hypothetical protein